MGKWWGAVEPTSACAEGALKRGFPSTGMCLKTLTICGKLKYMAECRRVAKSSFNSEN
jgi:hypothetical protein